MKSYNYLFEKFISEDNIKESIINASKNKKDRKEVQYALTHIDSYIKIIKKYALNYHNANHTPISIYDGICRKKRTIIVPTFKEQVIQHMVINIMKPIIMKGMYVHSYAAIPNRGVHKGKKVIEKWIKTDRKNVKYCLKMDIKHFFNSIPHDILKRKLSNIIHDNKFLHVINTIIDVTEVGIPLGYYTSQWLANWYLQELDYYIKQKMGAKYYIRYMDDMVIFASNKKSLHKMKIDIDKFLHDKLGLSLKENWQVFRFHDKDKYRFLDFMGFRFYRNRITVRRTIWYRVCRKARRIAKSDKPTIHECRQIISSLGWIKHTNVYQSYLDRIKPYVSFRYIKRRISIHDRIKRKKEKECKTSCKDNRII